MKDKTTKILKDVNSKGFFHLFSANTLIHLIEFASQLLVAWMLMVDDVGRIKSFQVYAAIAVIFAGLGFNTSVLKLCSERIERKEKESLFIAAFQYTLLVSILTFLVFIVIAKFKLLSIDNKTNELFVYYAFTIPVVALNNLLIAYFQALKAFKKVSLYLLLARIIHVVLIIGLTYYFQIEGFIFGVVFGFLFSLLLLLKNTGVKLTTKIKGFFLPHWNVAKYAFLGNATSSINLYLDFIILNHFIEDEEALGQYGFALTLMTGLRVFGYTVQQFVTPFYSENSDDVPNLKRMFRKSERIFTAISVIIGGLGIIIIPFFIHYVFAGKYDESMQYFLYLTIAWVLRSWYALKGPLLLSLGYVRYNFYTSVYLLVLSVIVYWGLIKNYGLLGAAYSQCITAFLGVIIVWLSLKKAMRNLNYS
ncbi:MAG: oligosaccharide flippase family protein [Vicingus serpentipes]|nr:oligosaccharide flippase family protein [Vicingus serpentipes]